MIISEDKEYFSFDEVLSFIAIRPYLLEFWIKEFNLGILDSDGTLANRLFTKEEMRCLGHIKRLLFEKHLSMADVKHFIQDKDWSCETQEEDAMMDDIECTSYSGWQVGRKIEKEQNDDERIKEELRIQDLLEKLHFVKSKLSNVTRVVDQVKLTKNW